MKITTTLLYSVPSFCQNFASQLLLIPVSFPNFILLEKQNERERKRVWIRDNNLKMES